ncbi:restriction endonuclease subunit S [Escherichia coli]|uniref:restriction endonuclease subunit S n=1 Tax=Escherichia albertii TaxID=208962 RepID=UPI0011EF914C|nr:restriction endonuclease subunit S [Escherichia albertii]EIH7011311.1 restriction endonuclease subunit S [Escherichia coli]
MSEMSYLEKLLDGVEVEWKTLGKVLKRTKGTKITAGQMKALHKDNAPLKIFAGGKTVAFVDFKDIPENDINREPSIIVKSRGIIEFEYYDKPFSHKNEMWSYHSNNDAISIKYIYYFLKINEGYFQKIGGKMQMPQIATPDTDKFEVPIPCPDNPEKSLAIQSEIVRILDKFTELTAELTAELSMRKKQYNYYRDQLLSFDEEQEKPIYLEKLLDGVEVEWRTLGEIAVIYDGTHKTPKYTASGVPFVSVQNIKNLYGTNKYISPEDFKTYKNKPRKHDLFMTRIGDVGTCAIVEDDRPLAYYVTLALIRINQQIAVPGFIRYLIESRFGKAELYKRTLIHAVPMKINLGEIGKVAVPIPCPDNPEKSLAIQSEIVRILDKFDTLTNSITEGLPREIELRQKQYEYYRDLLFSFPKPETVSN